MERLYRWLLHLYPAQFRSRFGSEVAEVFTAAREEASRQGAWSHMKFLARELLGVIQGARAQVRLQDGSRWLESMEMFANCRFVFNAFMFSFVTIVAAIALFNTVALHASGSHYLAPHASVSAVPLWQNMVCGAGIVAWTIGAAVRRVGAGRTARVKRDSARG